MSQEQLAEAVEVSVKHLSNIELGKRFISSVTLDLICMKLDVPLHYLFIDRNSSSDGRSTERTRSLVRERSIAFASELISELGLYDNENS